MPTWIDKLHNATRWRFESRQIRDRSFRSRSNFDMHIPFRASVRAPPQSRIADPVEGEERALQASDLPERLRQRILFGVGRGHCQTKFYTASWRSGTGRSHTVFAHESPTHSPRFDAENDLYSFALTVPPIGVQI